MSVADRISELLTTLEEKPTDEHALGMLLRLYLSDEVDGDQRIMIRMKTATVPEICDAYNTWMKKVTASDMASYVRLLTGVISITEGRPDPHSAAMLVNHLIKVAEQQGVDAVPHIMAVQRISSQAMREMLEERIASQRQPFQTEDERIDAVLD
ncbi:MAG: hypothetical protein GYB65_20265, partial [Chloroflexi bacterium]|nr:hypothetical protein [Chloroflexota bacterium]